MFDRAVVGAGQRSAETGWPALRGAVLDPDVELPAVAPVVAAPVGERLRALWSGRDLDPDLVAACIVRSSQLLGVGDDDPVRSYLVPQQAADRVDPADVRNWPDWPTERGRHELSLAEQLWMDPASVDAAVVEPLLGERGSDGLIRAAWHFILIGQLHRLALVLHGE